MYSDLIKDHQETVCLRTCQIQPPAEAKHNSYEEQYFSSDAQTAVGRTPGFGTQPPLHVGVIRTRTAD